RRIAGRHGRQRRPRAVDSAGRRGLRATHRMRKSREPALDARRIAPQGARPARRTRRRALAADAPVRRREFGAFARRRGGRCDAGALWYSRAARDRCGEHAARSRVRRGLVVAELSLAVMLVIGAGLLLKSFWNLMRVDAGFTRGDLTTF